jgi:tRNA-Thr(GGU) m(6)t(6)A37 methyltransferase TsaA
MTKNNNSNPLPSGEGRGGADSQITYSPIGFFKTGYTPETGGPRQGVLRPDGRGEIHIFEEFRPALKELDLFEYIIVLYHFSSAGKWHPTVNPPAAKHNHNFGLFSTRSPKRPNTIGFSIIKLEKIKDGVLHVSGVDAFDGSPVLDIKPYLPSVDNIKSEINERVEKVMGHHDEDFITDKTFYK